MKKIATHNSCTWAGYSKNWLYRLMRPVSECQRRDMYWQYEEGCRYFDIRVRKEECELECDMCGVCGSKGCTGKAYVYRVCHGLWKSGLTLRGVMEGLTSLKRDGEEVLVDIFYEGRLGDKEREEFLTDMDCLKKQYEGKVDVVCVGVKKPEWKELVRYRVVDAESNFVSITGWKVLWPFPKFWDKRIKDKSYNGDHYRRVDFL